MKDKANGGKLSMSADEISKAMMEFQKAMGAGPGAKLEGALQDSAGYAIGTQIGKDIARFKSLIDLDLVVQGIKDKLAGKPPRLTQEEMGTAMQTFQQKAMAAQAELAKVNGPKNLQDG